MQETNSKKTVGIIVVIVLLICLGFVSYANFHIPEKSSVTPILSFDDCAKAGNPVLESYPRQCKTSDGRTFAEEIQQKPTYMNASADMIVVDNPFPGAVVGKQFSVTGKARGTWFFEASFPINVLDKDGKVIASGIGQALTEWTTTDFVAFKSDIKVPESYIGPATLVLKKDNPSGLEEKEASVSFPITIEY